MKRLLGGESLSEVGPAIARTVAVAALLAAITLLAIVVTKPHGTYEVKAIFDDSRGLIEGGDVTAGFQKVGSVENITLGEDGLPHVTMRIDGGFRLHRGAFADLRLASNVGAVNRVVDLKQGNLSEPELGDGATLGPSQTDQPVDLDAAVSTLDPKTRADAARVLAGLDAATRGRGEDLNHLLRHSSAALNQTANVLGEVSTDGVALRGLVSDTSTVVGALAQDPNALGSAAERTATLLQTAGARQADLRRSVDAIGPALVAGRHTLQNLDAATPDLRGLVHEARPVVDRLAPVAERLPATIHELRPTIAQTRGLVRAGAPQAKELTPVIDASIPLLRELKPTLAQFNPLLDTLRVKAPEVSGFFQLGADAVSNYDVNGHMIRFIPRLIPFATTHTNEIGPSDLASGSLIRPFDRTPGSLEGVPWNDYGDSYVGGAKPVSDYTGGSP